MNETYQTLRIAALACGLFLFTAANSALASITPASNGSQDFSRKGLLHLAHGTNVTGPHCHRVWSTMSGWHLHARGCYLPQYNPHWRDPSHWHWRRKEEARQRRYERRQRRWHH